MTPQRTYKASLSRSQGRVGWSMIFRHPLRRDRDGQPGLRIRRGLGTSERIRAQALVDQMNQLLSDQSLWTPAARTKAEENFDPLIVSAFYENLAPVIPDYWGIREREIPLPSAEEGYARVLLLGTTGAGKTTVVRQLIGTDPKTERFPSISSAKTTISDLEIVLNQEGPFRSIVSFFDRSYILQHIEECVLAAVMAHIEGGDDNEVERKLLEHSEQRFRLSYLLGTTKLLAPPKATADDELMDDELLIDEENEEDRPDVEVSIEERQLMLTALTSYQNQIHELAKFSNEALSQELEFTPATANTEDRIAFLELLEGRIDNDEAFHKIIDQIFDDVESKFNILTKGEIARDDSDWPSSWTYSTNNRKEFISTINRFSSNYAPNFGRLLTPLVEGIRVIGPFTPSWHTGGDLRLVIMDREGLGHTPDLDTSVSTSITKRYQSVDAILLVDNAAQPMQAAPTALIQSLVSSGHHAKLIVGFTHFDEVRGDNLPNMRMRMDHVLNSLDNAATAVGRKLGTRAERVLQDVKNGRVFFMMNVHRPIKAEPPSFTRNQLMGLIEAIQQSIVPPPPTEVIPIYDLADFNMAIQTATRSFHYYWRAALNLRSDSNISPEHWTRIKALTRRLGLMGRNEYKSLRPVADLLKNLSDQIYLFLENPAQWNPVDADSDKRQAALDQIIRGAGSALHELVRERLESQPALAWQTAFYHSGRGSAAVRAYDIRTIYDRAAPIPNETGTIDSRSFVQALRKLVIEAIQEGGGQVQESTMILSRT